jgi:DNA-binding NarL/FixJ family response regulator
MQKISVLVANQPRLLRELVISILSEQFDMEVLQSAGLEQFVASDLGGCLEKFNPDFLITTLENSVETGQRCAALLRRFPGLKIIAMSAHHDDCLLYGKYREIYSMPVVVSEQGILNALRGNIKHSTKSGGRALRKAS